MGGMAIVLYTDFGSRDPYVGQVKAVLGTEAPGVNIVDLLNDAPAFNAKASAHLLAALAPVFAPGTVFMAVVDPGVGGPRDAVVVRAGGQVFVGPDNGLLSVLAARSSNPEYWRISWSPASMSASFHGRDLFAPVAARIAAGTMPEDHLERLQRLAVEFGPGDLAEIVYVDHYGNAMTGLRACACPQGATLWAGDKPLHRARTFSQVAEGHAFWYENSAGLIEISVNRGSAASVLRLSIGDPVVVG